MAVISDARTRRLGDLLASRARRITDRVTHLVIPPLAMHGAEPPVVAARAMKRAALSIGITSKSMAHTRARIRAAAAGARYLSLPDYSPALMADSSLRADYVRRGRLTRRIADIFTNGNRVRVRTKRGTDISMCIQGRVGNCCPGYVERPGDLGSPPDIEANVSPIENSAVGVVVVDGSIPYPGFGRLKKSVRLTVQKGKIVRIEGPDMVASALTALFERVGSSKAYVLAECGVGLNDLAHLTGVMLTDEGSAGTMHFGFGSNSTVGGKNAVPFHLDAVFRKPTLEVDGRRILERGVCLVDMGRKARKS